MAERVELAVLAAMPLRRFRVVTVQWAGTVATRASSVAVVVVVMVDVAGPQRQLISGLAAKVEMAGSVALVAPEAH
jgi:hypothetical protein